MSPSFKKIKFPNIGVVSFEKSLKAKHVNIYIKSLTYIRVAVPQRVTFDKAKKVVLKNENWIIKNLKKIRLVSKKNLSANPICRKKAREYLLKRLDYLAKKNGFNYNKATIRNQKTRWGSCSLKNNISLNMQLMNLPDKLIDYVILHELVHTKVKNHSIKFWEMLDSFIPNSKLINKTLNNYRIHN